MKTLLLATTIAMASTAAYADGLGFNGYGEYAMEAESFEFGAGATYGVDSFEFYVETVFVKPNGAELDFTEATFGVAYAINDNANVYAEVTTDSDFDYDEAVIGLAFQF